MAKNNLRDFLIKMAHDKNMQFQFRDGGMEEMMTAAGLNGKEKTAVRSGDAAKIRNMVGPPKKPGPPILCHAIYGSQIVSIEL